MPWYPDPAGGRMEVANMQEAQQRGWTPSMGTFGAESGLAAGQKYEGQATSSGAPATGPAAVAAAAATPTTGVQQVDAWIREMQKAAAEGNKAALEEKIREFNATFGLDEKKFGEDIRRYNQNFGLSLVTTAAGLQANPFRQAQVIGQLGGLLKGTGVAGFQAPGQAQGQTDFSGMGNLQRLIDDIRGGPGAINQQSVQSVLDAIPTPAKLDSVNFLRATPLTQSLVLQGMQEKYGLSPDDSLAQIKNTLPQFQAPTTFAAVKR